MDAMPFSHPSRLSQRTTIAAFLLVAACLSVSESAVAQVTTLPQSGAATVSPPCPGTADQIAANAAMAAQNMAGAQKTYVPDAPNLGNTSCFATHWAEYIQPNHYDTVLSSFLSMIIKTFTDAATSAVCSALVKITSLPGDTINGATSSLLNTINGAAYSIGNAAAAPIVNTAGSITQTANTAQGVVVNGVSQTAQGAANSAVSGVQNSVGTGGSLTNFLTGR
jgi:hypothetical protein